MDKHIQWFPGHIAKGTRDILELTKNVDLLIEVLDSRGLFSSKQDDYLKDKIGSKPLIYVLNKIDLTDLEDLKKWEEEFKNNKVDFCSFSSLNNSINNELISLIKKRSNLIREKYLKKGIKNKTVRCLILGIPNVGKSTVINRLLHRKQLVTKNIPGVTRKINEVKLDEFTRIFDSAGVLPPTLDNQENAIKMCLLNTISSKVFSFMELSKYLFNYLFINYRDLLIKYCDNANVEKVEDVFNFLTIKRNLVIKNSEDFQKQSEIFVRDFQDGRIGKISLEKCDITLIESFIKNTNI